MVRDDNAGVMSDGDRCRLIAELEGLPMPPDYSSDPDYSLKAATAFERFPDYAHDLNATMQAARRLPYNINLVVSMRVGATVASVEQIDAPAELLIVHVENNPARAAYLALSDYLATKKESR